MIIGEKIKIARKKAGLTQEQLARKLNVSQAMIGQYENGKRKPKFETLEKIANVLNVSIDELNPSIAIGKAIIETPGALEELCKILDVLADTAESILLNDLVTDFDKLNPLGKEEACKRVNELTQIDRYTSTEYDES